MIWALWSLEVANKMNKPLRMFLPAAAALALLAAGRAQASDDVKALNFDQGVQVGDILGKAKELAAKDATVITPAQMSSNRYESDCVRFTFSPNDQPVSDAIWLRSTEWVTECRPYGGDPRRGGGGQNCYERPGYTYNERVQITLKERQPLFPWESDSFRVCLQGPWLDVNTLSSAYEYNMVQGGNRNGNIVLAPGRKLAMKPDPAGITAQLSGAMLLSLTDKWASFYSGADEKVVLKVTLKKDVPNWFDPTLIETELESAVVPARIDLKQFAAKFSQKLEAGKKYYVDLSFKRVGRISKGDYVKSGETTPTAYQPASVAVGR